MGIPYPPSTRRSAQTKYRIRSSTCPASDRSPEPTAPTSPIYPEGRASAFNYNGEDSAISRPPHHWETDGERKVFLHDYDVHIPALLKDGWTGCFSPKTLSYLKFLEEEDIQTEVEAEEEELFCTCFGMDDGSKMVECANADDGCLMRWFHVACLSNEAQRRGLAREGTLSRALFHITEDEQGMNRSGRTMTDDRGVLDVWFCDRCIKRNIGLLRDQKQPTTMTKGAKRKKAEDCTELQISKKRKSSGTKTQDKEEIAKATSRKPPQQAKRRALPPPKLKPTKTIRASIEIPEASPVEFSLTAPLQPADAFYPSSSCSTSPESFMPLRVLTVRTGTAASFPQPTPSKFQPITPQPRSRSWASHEEILLTAVMKELSAQDDVSGASLWARASELMADHGVERSPSAAKAIWSRVLRERSGIDERKSGSGGPMRTSLQKRKYDVVGRERERRGSV